MTPLAIAHLFTHDTVTRGGAVQGLLLARIFQEHGHRVAAFFHAPIGVSIPAMAFDHPATRDLDIHRLNMKNPLSYVSFRRWLQQEQIDIVHTHKSLALLFGYFSTLGLYRPALVVNRGTTYPFKNPLAKRIIHDKRVRHVIVVAEAVKDTLTQVHQLPPERISVVYGSFDEQRFTPTKQDDNIRRGWGISESDPLVVCIAAIDRRKGLQVLLHAAREVLYRFPTAKFLLVGHSQNRDHFEALQHDVRHLGLVDRVIFTGHRTDVAAILAAADVAVNASTEGEGLTGALREALAMKKPVVCTAIDGNTEIVQDPERGWVVAPGDAHALATALIEALRDPNEANRRAVEGYNWVMQHCTAELRYEKMEAIYRRLVCS